MAATALATRLGATRGATFESECAPNDVAQAILVDGGRHGRRGGQTAEIADYRRIVSCLANGLSSPNFTQALRDLGTAVS
ncbi:hypothetical protein [Bradyrhizobium sp. sBnM-33]|uniref:hypothetical protein n=1 Tax=Bradyrhizobium sp. sBnM-33 TaxID=2831780 RepID=UPI001BD04657|nr:hypothetical protein [Bradyrhizobium sp. sBnM-33]WOH46937.1 hypothetical protein RX328_22220 [Bradyrhizobium sp. sBnM-33]